MDVWTLCGESHSFSFGCINSNKSIACPCINTLKIIIEPSRSKIGIIDYLKQRSIISIEETITLKITSNVINIYKSRKAKGPERNPEDAFSISHVLPWMFLNISMLFSIIFFKRLLRFFGLRFIVAYFDILNAGLNHMECNSILVQIILHFCIYIAFLSYAVGYNTGSVTRACVP